MEEFFPQNENLKTVLCRPNVEKSQNCEIFFWGYDGRLITRAEFTGMMWEEIDCVLNKMGIASLSMKL